MQYAVERLLRHRSKQDGTTEFLIKWVDYDTPIWTARTHVPEALGVTRHQLLRSRTGMDLNSNVNADVHA